MIAGGFATGVITRVIRPAEAAPEDVRIADLDWVDFVEKLRDRGPSVAQHRSP